MVSSLIRQSSTHYMMTRSLEHDYNEEEGIIIARPEALKAKIKKMVKDGPKNLLIFTDFDFTLTKKNVGKTAKGDSSFKILQDVPAIFA